VASCNDDAGALPYATHPISRSLTPHWDELAVFKDVAPTDRLHVSVLDRRLMGPHLLLGQVRSHAGRYARMNVRCKYHTRLFCDACWWPAMRNGRFQTLRPVPT
jgi:C2 domain